jgi:hypothetical protein
MKKPIVKAEKILVMSKEELEEFILGYMPVSSFDPSQASIEFKWTCDCDIFMGVVITQVIDK